MPQKRWLHFPPEMLRATVRDIETGQCSRIRWKRRKHPRLSWNAQITWCRMQELRSGYAFWMHQQMPNIQTEKRAEKTSWSARGAPLFLSFNFGWGKSTARVGFLFGWLTWVLILFLSPQSKRGPSYTPDYNRKGIISNPNTRLLLLRSTFLWNLQANRNYLKSFQHFGS